MANIFHSSTNILSRLSVVLVLVTVGLVLGGWDQFLRSFYVTKPITFNRSIKNCKRVALIYRSMRSSIRYWKINTTRTCLSITVG